MLFCLIFSLHVILLVVKIFIKYEITFKQRKLSITIKIQARPSQIHVSPIEICRQMIVDIILAPNSRQKKLYLHEYQNKRG